MTSALVQKFRDDVAPRMLAKYGNGGVAVVITVTTPNPDPLMPPTSDITTSEVNAYACGVSANILTGDTNLVATDLQIICAAVDFVPAVGGHVSINSSARTVVRVDAIPAAGDAAIYRFFVR